MMGAARFLEMLWMRSSGGAHIFVLVVGRKRTLSMASHAEIHGVFG
jgi:hypothetical protein